MAAWEAADAKARTLMVALLATNAALNLLWSPLFFKLRRPDWALYEWVPFWLSIVSLVVLMFQISTLAGWLMAPYLAWVTYRRLAQLARRRPEPPLRDGTVRRRGGR